MSPGVHSYQAGKMSLDSHSCRAEETGGLSSAGRGGPSTEPPATLLGDNPLPFRRAHVTVPQYESTRLESHTKERFSGECAILSPWYES